MKQLTRKLCSAICCLTLLGALLPASAASPATVHATACLRPVYVDGVEVSFLNTAGEYTYLFSLDGAVYLPANIAAAWLGCQLSVSQSGASATFTSGQKAQFPGRNSAPELTKEGLARLNRYFDKGVDVQPLTSFSVKVDGKAWTFSGGKSPFFVDGTLYLPLRDVGVRLGKDVLWVPDPVSSEYALGFISIHTRPTQAQLAEMQTYLDQCLALYRQAEALARQAAVGKGLTPAKAADLLAQTKSTLNKIGALPAPSYHYLDTFEISAFISPITYREIDECTKELRSGAMTLQAYRSDHAYYTDITLQGRYRVLDFAQQALDFLVAAQSGR